MWEEVVEKIVYAETKARLQLPSKVRKINSRCPKDYKPPKKDKSSWNHQDDQAKSSHNFPPVNTYQLKAQTQTQAFKQNKYYQRSHQGDHLAIGINTTKVAKKNKDKANNWSHIKYYIYKQKDHYVNKYSKSLKN